MAEWLRRWTANPLGSARAGSNPADVAFCYNSIVVSTPRCGRGDPGSIPGCGNFKNNNPVVHLFVAMGYSLP